VNHFFSDIWQAHSAGTEATIVKPWAVDAMANAGIDINHHHSKTLKEVEHINFDVVVTLCDSAKTSCPIFLGGGKRVHHSFVDPSDAEGDKLEAFCKTRDEIKGWLDAFLPQFS
jgi:arsenate reductase